MAGPNINRRRVWANSVIFSVNLLSYSVLTTDTVLFADLTATNGIMVLPSAANPAKCFTLKRIDTSNNILAVTTDDVECLLNGSASLNISSISDAMSCIMGDDGNYYTIVNGGGGVVDLSGYPNNSQMASNLVNYELITDLTANYPNNSQLSSNLTYFVNTAQLTSNLGNYPNTIQLTNNLANYQTTVGLAANVLTLVANNTSYVGAVTAANVVSNAQLQANLGNYSNTTQFTNNLANYQTTAGLPANVVTLTANNTSYVGAVTAVNVISNAQLSGNLGWYPNTIQLTNNLANYQTTAGLSANVATLTANSASYVGALIAVNVVSNAQLSGNLSAYQTTAGLSANVATLTANNASYIGGLIASNVVSNAQLSGNLGAYQTTAGLASNVAILTANNSSYLGTVAAASYQQTGAPLTNNVATMSANNSSYLGGVVAANYVNTTGSFIITGVHTYGNLTVNSVINSTAYLIGAINSTAVGLLLANNLITLGNSSVNATINSTTFSGISLTANNATNLGGTAAAGYQTTAGLSANVATLSANNSSYLGTVAAASYQQTGAPLTNNVATLTANNSTYLGGVTSGSYINTSGSYVITGVHTYGNLTVNSVINSTAYLIGAINSTAVGISIANNLLTIGNSSVNATINSTTFSGISLTANNATNLGGTAAAGYQTTAGLSANVATLTANSASYAGSLIASNVVSNAQLSANLGAYQTSAGLAANVAHYAAFSFRNRIINGDMRIDQRNVGAQQIVTTAGAYTADRWGVYPTGNSVATQRVSNTSFPSGYALLVRGNTAITKCAIATHLEANENFDLIKSNVTLSAIMSSTTVTSVTWGLQTPTALDNYAGWTNNVSGTWTINSTPTPYTATFVANAAGGNGMGIYFELGAFTSGNTYISDVQLEGGSVASPFERLPTMNQLMHSQRYFSKSYVDSVVPGTNVGQQAGGITFIVSSTAQAGYFGSVTSFPVNMRVTPSVIIYDNAGGAGTVSYISVATGTWVNSGSLNAGVPSNITNKGLIVQCANTCYGVSCDYTANAEIY